MLSSESDSFFLPANGKQHHGNLVENFDIVVHLGQHFVRRDRGRLLRLHPLQSSSQDDHVLRVDVGQAVVLPVRARLEQG